MTEETLRINIHSSEFAQTVRLSEAMHVLNTRLEADGFDAQYWVDETTTKLCDAQGRPHGVDALAVSLRSGVIPGYEDEEHGWKTVAGIPRPAVRALMDTPAAWYKLPRYRANPDRGTGWEWISMERVADCPEAPLVGHREDGEALFYRGKVNVVFGDSEGGKTWLCLLAAKQELDKGHGVAYMDYEDGPQGIKSRLAAMGLDDDTLNEGVHFKYAAPWGPLGSALESEAFVRDLAGCTLIVVDAMTEALSAAGLNSNSDVEVARWFNEFARPIASLGPAVVIVDHTPKAADNKAQQTGSQHKKSAVDGASVSVGNKSPFRPGGDGHSEVVVGKDRPGGVRAVSADGKRFGELRMDKSGPHTLRIEVAEERATPEERELALDMLVGPIVDSLTAAGASTAMEHIKALYRAQGHRARNADLEASIRRVKRPSPPGGDVEGSRGVQSPPPPVL